MNRALGRVFLFIALSALTLEGCGGSVNTTPVPGPTQGAQTITSPAAGGVAATYALTSGAPSGLVVTLVASQSAPSGIAAPASSARAKTSGTSTVSDFLYVTLTVNKTVPASLFTTETIPLGSLNPAATYAVEIDDPSLAAPRLLTVPGTLASGVPDVRERRRKRSGLNDDRCRTPLRVPILRDVRPHGDTVAIAIAIAIAITVTVTNRVALTNRVAVPDRIAEPLTFANAARRNRPRIVIARAQRHWDRERTVAADQRKRVHGFVHRNRHVRRYRNDCPREFQRTVGKRDRYRYR